VWRGGGPVSAPNYVSAHQKESLRKTVAIDSFCPGHSFSPLNLLTFAERANAAPFITSDEESAMTGTEWST